MFTDKKKLLKTLFVCAGALSFVHASVPIAPDYVGANKVKLDETNTSVRISFDDNSTDEDGFYISVHNYTDDTPFATIAVDSTSGDHGYANITGLTCEKTYQATVIAYNEDGNSTGNHLTSFNMQSTFGTTCDGNSSLKTPLQPGPYIGVTSLNHSTSAVRVNFKDNSDNEDGFRLFDGDGIDVTIPANDRAVHPDVYVNLTGLTCTQIYGLQVVAYKGALESLPTPVRTFRIETTFSGIDCGGNHAPTADAGDDRTLALEDEGTIVSLDGSDSEDSDGDPITYAWSFISKPAGSTATLSDSSLVNPTFTADINGTYTLQLIVNDGKVDSEADRVIITVLDQVLPQSPIAIAHVSDSNITEGVLVTFDANSSYDPDGNIESYEWKENGVTLSNNKEFSLNTLTVGTHTIILTVTDDEALTGSDTVIIRVKKLTNQGVSFHTAFMSNSYGQINLSFFILCKRGYYR